MAVLGVQMYKAHTFPDVTLFSDYVAEAEQIPYPVLIFLSPNT